MANEKLLATFVAEELKETFNIYGEYEVSVGKEIDIISTASGFIEFNYPEFYYTSATRVVDGKEETYIPKGESWVGRKYTAEDMIQFLISALIKGDETYTKIYLDPGLEKIIEEYIKDSEIAIAVEGKDVPKRILTNSMYYLYQLMLVTNEYIYYSHENGMYMLSTDTHQVVSDNYFAEVGFWDSVENVRNGKEKLLWGELPEE